MVLGKIAPVRRAWVAGLGLVLTVAAGSAGYAQPSGRKAPALVRQSIPAPGAKLFKRWCSDCHHTAMGPGAMALQRKYQGAVSALLEQRTDITPDLVKYFVRNGSSFMPPFRKTEISDAELDRLAAYLSRSAKSARSPVPAEK